MKLEHNNLFNHQFAEIPGIRFYPYVGKNFNKQEKRIIVFAHNIYCKPEKYEAEQIRTKSRTHFADALEEYTYRRGWWTKSWRNFIKASLSINFNFTSNSNNEIISKIDDFVEKISYVNYINDIVKSKGSINVDVGQELINKSNNINKELLDILNITHCVCWGKDVFKYLTNLDIYEVIESYKLPRKGFEYAKLRNTEKGTIIHSLKIFHPSMPSFGVYNKETQKILEDFYKKE